MPHTDAGQARASRLLTMIATILLVAVLYLAREVLVPIALALLLCFLLGPLVNRLERWGLGRIGGVLAATVLSSAIMGAIGYVVVVEAVSLAESLPQYRHNIREKVRTLAAPGILSHATQSIKIATEDAIRASTQPDGGSTQPATASATAPGGAETQPTPPTRVEIAEPALSPVDTIRQTVHPFLGPLGVAGIVIVFVVFLLIQREDLRDRIIALTGSSQIHAATSAIDDAASRVSRYILMQLIVNVTYGIPVAIGLMLIGVPNALLWGVLCIVFRYIPYLGPWIGASLPIILSLAVFDDWTRPLIVVGMFVVIELISNNVVEPWLYGSETGLSPVAVLAAAVFWGWLWGIPGLVLAVPLTVCVVVLGQYIPQMRWLSVLLGDRPSLPLHARIYQRLLSSDDESVMEMALDYLKTHSLLEFYDEALMPALAQSETDRYEGHRDDERAAGVLAGMRVLVEELGDQPDHTDAGDRATADADDVTSPDATVSDDQPPIAVVAARDYADEIAGMMLAQVIERTGRRCQWFAPGQSASDVVEEVLALAPSAICVSAMPPMAVGHARLAAKRLRAANWNGRLVTGVWSPNAREHAARRLPTGSKDAIVATLAEALASLDGERVPS